MRRAVRQLPSSVLNTPGDLFLSENDGGNTEGDGDDEHEHEEMMGVRLLDDTATTLKG